MPAGASKKREREYEKLKKSLRQSGRYRGREEQVAARIVNKQRRQYGETKRAKARRARGEANDRKLPIRDYETLTVPQIKRQLDGLSARQVDEVHRFELQHKNRKTLIPALLKAV